MASNQPTGNVPLRAGQIPRATKPVKSNRPNVILTSTQPTANMPLRPSAFNVQQQQQQQPPQLGMQQGPAASASVQHPQHMQSQPLQEPTTARPHTAAGHQQPPTDLVQHQTPGHMQPQLGVTKPTPNPSLQLLPAASRQHGLMTPMMKGDSFRFTEPDDHTLLKQVQRTHLPDGRAIEVKPLIHIVEGIFKLADPSIGAISDLETRASVEALEDKTYQTGSLGMLEVLAYVIDRISCEITCKCSGGGDAHVTAISILNMVTSYSWDAKLALALSAFAVTYGEIVKQLSEILEHTHVLKPQSDAIKNLFRAILDVSKCIVQFSELPSQYITAENEALSSASAHIPVAVYWTIRSILACASQLTGLTLFGREHMVSTTEAWELSSLAHELSNMHSHLLRLLHNCHKYIDEKKYPEPLHKILLSMSHIDNRRSTRALSYPKDDLLPLVNGATKTRVNLEVLRRKMVLLLISDLDISQEEVIILEQLYSEARQHQTRHESLYEVVWLPIVDPDMPWTDNKQKQFQSLQLAMPWYTVYHPSVIDRAVIPFIKEKWQFGKKPILVVLDPYGKVLCQNALHMMWIWGSLAYPFSTAREEALWREETWRLELLVDGLDPVILNWMAEGRYICLYGGEGMDWIRKFTTATNGVAKAAGIPLGMVYVGKSNPKDRVRRNNETIALENLSHIWQDLTSIWYFWVRLESMWYSKVQLGRTAETDHVMQEIMRMLTYDSSEGGWAVFARGSAEMASAKGAIFLTCMQEYNTVWKDQVEPKGFLPAMRDHLAQLHTPRHCIRLVLPGTADKIPERLICSECGRVMEIFLMYRCCDE
ncbi:hypothetical protein AB3S75_007198 [Citrus x aurantiifolia]